MPKRLSSTEMIRALEQHGFCLASQKGSHRKYKNAAGRITIVPHPKKEVPIGTTRAIVRQSGLDPKDFGF
jgi:predicted RNA binding protein YcfA (HicA-like mRNA interferase family)